MPAVSRTNNIDQNKSKLVAAMLAIFLGAIGIHKFYLGKSGKGIMYLLFFWTFIPAIVGFFEGIGLLMQNQQSFDAEYNQ